MSAALEFKNILILGEYVGIAVTCEYAYSWAFL